MLKASPIQSKEEQKKLVEECGAVFKEDLLCYSMYDDDKLIAICQFKTSSIGAQIFDFCAKAGVDDKEAMFILFRAVLNFIDLCGVHKAYYLGNTLDEAFIKWVGFSKNEKGEWFFDMTDFFNHPCAHKNNA